MLSKLKQLLAAFLVAASILATIIPYTLTDNATSSPSESCLHKYVDMDNCTNIELLDNKGYVKKCPLKPLTDTDVSEWDECLKETYAGSDQLDQIRASDRMDLKMIYIVGREEAEEYFFMKKETVRQIRILLLHLVIFLLPLPLIAILLTGFTLCKILAGQSAANNP